MKEASQFDECTTLKEKEENLSYTNEYFKEAREEIKTLERGKDLTLQTYGVIDNRVETLLQAPAENDDGPEGEDIL
jgi:ATP-dependent Lon protease